MKKNFEKKFFFFFSQTYNASRSTMCLRVTEREASPIRFLSCAVYLGFVDLSIWRFLSFLT